jgi:hypothetical protein
MGSLKGLWLCLATVAALGLLFGGSGVVLAGAGQAAAAPTSTRPPLPPTPTASPSPASTATPAPARRVEGGTIELQVRFARDWPWDEVGWQGLWTVVQWQDRLGGWRDVTGWQGNLDRVASGADGVVGYKVWWVAGPDLGHGPFRWAVYRDKGRGEGLFSRPFDLPGAAGGAVTAEVEAPR